MTRIEPALRAALGLAFLAAGILKIADPAAFAFSMARLQAVPRSALGPVAILLPWIEVTAAAALLFVRPWRRAALLLLGVLLAGFTAILGVALLRGASGSCGCFGVEGGFLARPEVAVVRNFLLLGIAAALARVERRRPATCPEGPSQPA